MKILNDQKVSLLDNLTKVNTNKSLKDNSINGKSNNSDMPDKVELSSRRQEVETIKAKVKAVPVIRQEKVDRLREAVKAETYNVNGQLVAKSIMKNHFIDEIL